jgi:hypothetical protein
MRNKNNSEKFSEQQFRGRMAEELIPYFLLEQCHMNKTCKVKEGLPSKD